MMDLSSQPKQWKVGAVTDFIENSEGFVFITMKSELEGVTDHITRIYSKGSLKYHGSDHIAILLPDGKVHVSPQGMSAFCVDKEAEQELQPMVGTTESFLYWVKQSQYLFVFTGRRVRDLLDGCKVLDEQLGTIFHPFFKECSDEFRWVMSDGRKVGLDPNR